MLAKLLSSLALGLAAAALGLLPLGLLREGGALAGPEAAAIQVVTLNTAAITQTTTWDGGRWAALGSEQPPSLAEFFVLVDAEEANTTTFTLEISPDNETWLPHNSAGTLATEVVADTNTYTRTTAEGIFWRVVATVTNEAPITPVIRVVLR